MTAHASGLELSPMRVEDAEELFGFLGDPASWAYDPPRVHGSVAQTREYAARAAACWAEGLSYWTVRVAGEVVGSGGAQRHEPPGVVPFWNLNYRIAPAHRGRGHATALAAAGVAAALEVDPALPVIAWVDDGNPVSGAVARRAGLLDQGLRHGAFDGVVRRAWADRELDAGHPPAG